jgi:histone H3/H4
MNDNDKEKKGIWTMLKQGVTGAVEDVKEMGADISEKALNKAVSSEAVQEAGAKYIREAIVDSVKDVKDHTGALVKEAKVKIVGAEDIKVYDTIRAGLRSENDGIFKKIFKNVVARVMTAAAGIGGWVGATFVNTAFSPAEAEKVQPNDVTQIFGSFMSKVFSGGRKATA